jgi:hypothetical protein
MYVIVMSFVTEFGYITPSHQPFITGDLGIFDSLDYSKELNFDLSNYTTNSIRTITLPDRDIILLGRITNTKGQLQVDDGTTVIPLSVGANRSILVSDSTQPGGIGWDDVIAISPGLTSAPSYTFDGFLTTGLSCDLNGGIESVHTSTSGIERSKISSNGAFFYNSGTDNSVNLYDTGNTDGTDIRGSFSIVGANGGAGFNTLIGDIGNSSLQILHFPVNQDIIFSVDNSGTPLSMVLKSTSGDLHIEDGGILTSGLSTGPGSPEYSFISNTNCGMYSSNANVLNLSTNSANRLEITSVGVVQPGANGTQDLGSSVATWKDIYSDSIVLSTGCSMYSSNANVLNLSTNSANRLEITSVGVVQPGANGTQDLGSSVATWKDIYSDSIVLSTGCSMYSSNANVLNLSTNSANRLEITSVGVVQPGANGTQDLGSSGASWKDIYSDRILVSNGGLGNPSISFSADTDTGIRYLSSNNRMIFESAGVPVVQISGTGLSPWGSSIFDLGDISNPWLHVRTEYIDSGNPGTLRVGTDGNTNSLQMGRVGIDTRIKSNNLFTLNITPSANNTYDIGTGSNSWRDIYISDGTVATSDGNLKNIEPEFKYGLDFINKLQPITFKWKDGGSRLHLGLKSQDIETLIQNKDCMDFGGFIKSPYYEYKEDVKVTEIDEKTQEETEVEIEVVKKKVISYDKIETLTAEGVQIKYTYGLRFNEFIAPLIQAVKDLSKQVNSLQMQIDVLQNSN